MKNPYLVLAGALVLAAGHAVRADVIDRPAGIKIGSRLTLRPYVSTSLTYDSNVGSSARRKGNEDCLWTISPTLGLDYNAENWSLLMSAFYNYRYYFEDRQHESRHEYGQDFRWNWSNSSGAERGWSLILGESFRQVTRADDLTLSDGSNYSGDYRQFQLSGAVQRRINEHWHGDINSSYYWLDYMNNAKNLNTYYGWDRWTVGAEAGFAPSKWTDILLSGSYQGYSQDNLSGSGYAGDSQGWSVQGGIGSYMTERISYRLLAGWSRFEYGDGLGTENGFVYTASGNWRIGETWNTMFLATSYYQPSERQWASKSRVDALSWGLAKSLVRGKLRATLDLRYRRETQEYMLRDGGDWDYVLNIITGRVGLDYTLNRFLSTFAYLEYQKSMNDEASSRNDIYDYDRWRATVGVRLTY